MPDRFEPQIICPLGELHLRASRWLHLLWSALPLRGGISVGCDAWALQLGVLCGFFSPGLQLVDLALIPLVILLDVVVVKNAEVPQVHDLVLDEIFVLDPEILDVLLQLLLLVGGNDVLLVIVLVLDALVHVIVDSLYPERLWWLVLVAEHRDVLLQIVVAQLLHPEDLALVDIFELLDVSLTLLQLLLVHVVEEVIAEILLEALGQLRQRVVAVIVGRGGGGDALHRLRGQQLPAQVPGAIDFDVLHHQRLRSAELDYHHGRCLVRLVPVKLHIVDTFPDFLRDDELVPPEEAQVILELLDNVVDIVPEAAEGPQHVQPSRSALRVLALQQRVQQLRHALYELLPLRRDVVVLKRFAQSQCE